MRVLALDTETNGQDVRDPNSPFKLLGVSYSYTGGKEDISKYLPVGHFGDGNMSSRDALLELQELLDSCDYLVFHNARFDLQTLYRGLGLDLWGMNWYCTMVMQHFIDENFMNKSLESMGQFYFGEGKERDESFKHFVEGPGWAFLPIWLTRPYAIQDAKLTEKTFQRIWPDFVKQGFDGELWEIEKDFMRALSSMESIGVATDADLAERELELGQRIMGKITKQLGGLNPSSGKDLEELLINQLGLPLVKPTKGTKDKPKEEWKPSFDKNAMEEYELLLSARNDPTAKLVLEYRGWQKACSTYFQSFLEKRGKDGRIRANFHLHKARTTRLTCSDPNLQQIPRETNESKRWNLNTKKCIVPSSGYRLWELDYANLELRLAAIYSGQKTLIHAFNSNEKIWDFMSHLLGGWEKNKTKTTTYAILYGAGAARLALTMGVSSNEGYKTRKKYFSTFPRLQWCAETINQGAKDQGYVSLWTRRRRHFPRTESTHKAFNSVLQGGGAECVKRALIQIWKELCDYGRSSLCKLVLTVHDSIVLEIKEGYEYKFLDRAKEIMESIPSNFFSMHFAVDVHEWGQ